ncbi:MAG: tRNA threonylcarbamoyladenosine biosynthesis protein RimN [Methylococcaceae bacterium]|nr:tRNA threonylcarbamoyladenosine biosynthesis protein RimN [Methylococcaceae bacterium]
MSQLSRFKLQQACHQLEDGNIIAYPTEAIYGLGCDPFNEDAAIKLLELKQRSMDKGLILIAADFMQLEPFLDYDEKILQRVQENKSEVITWVIPAQAWVPKWLTGKHSSLAVRVTSHPLSKALCEQFDSPLVSTSANPSSKKPARNALQVRRYFSKYPSLKIINGKTGGNKNPSKIYDALTGNCLRT